VANTNCHWSQPSSTRALPGRPECAYPHGRRQVWFDRAHGNGFSFPGDGLKGDREKLAEFTRPNSLFLTVAASLNQPQLSAIHRWFLDNQWIVTPGDDIGGAFARHLLTGSPDKERYRKRIEALLRAVDLGVAGLQVDPALATDEQIRLLHHSGTAAPVPLDFTRQESSGTFAWFGLLGPLLDVLEQGTVLLVDDLDASLHPMLAAEIIRLFQNPAANPDNAQLIFTAHEPTRLGTSVGDRPVDRDQVWITSKNQTGETELYPLIDARPRREENLERGYLNGRYGGVPRLTGGELAREVTRVLAEAD